MIGTANDKHVGIFFCFGPTDIPRKEGIGRLTGIIVKAMLDYPDCHITIAAPAWGQFGLEELLQDHQIDDGRVKIITTPDIPFIIRLILWRKGIHLSKPKQGRGRLKRFKQRLAQQRQVLIQNLYFFRQKLFFRPRHEAFAQLIQAGMPLSLRRLFSKPLHMTSAIAFFLTLPFIAVGSLLVAIPALIVFGCYGLFSLCRSYRRKRRPPRRFVAHSAAPRSAKSLLTTWKEQTYLTILHREANRLVGLCNSQRDVQRWFVPTAAWAEATKLDKPLIAAVPDIIFNDFPTYFTDYYMLQLREKVACTIHAAEKVICYSHYVKDVHVVRDSGCDPNKVVVIKHGRHDLNSYLKHSPRHPTEVTVYQSLQKYAFETLMSRRAASILLDESYLVFTTQFRGYKNTERLIEALRLVIDQYDRPLNLVLTGHLSDQRVNEAVRKFGLQPRVLFAYNLSSNLLAMINQRAALSVNPSLFEGGFPGTFGEAYSVGTPSVMSAIPATLETITDDTLRNLMLFDPYDVHAMADRIVFGLNNRSLLLQRQKQLYQSLPSWESVAGEYLDCFGFK